MRRAFICDLVRRPSSYKSKRAYLDALLLPNHSVPLLQAVLQILIIGKILLQLRAGGLKEPLVEEDVVTVGPATLTVCKKACIVGATFLVSTLGHVIICGTVPEVILLHRHLQQIFNMLEPEAHDFACCLETDTRFELGPFEVGGRRYVAAVSSELNA